MAYGDWLPISSLMTSILMGETISALKNLNFPRPHHHTFSFLRRSRSTSSISNRQPSCMVWKDSWGARVNSDCLILSSCSRISGNRGLSRGFERQHAVEKEKERLLVTFLNYVLFKTLERYGPWVKNLDFFWDWVSCWSRNFRLQTLNESWW